MLNRNAITAGLNKRPDAIRMSSGLWVMSMHWTSKHVPLWSAWGEVKLKDTQVWRACAMHKGLFFYSLLSFLECPSSSSFGIFKCQEQWRKCIRVWSTNVAGKCFMWMALSFIFFCPCECFEVSLSLICKTVQTAICCENGGENGKPISFSSTSFVHVCCLSACTCELHFWTVRKCVCACYFMKGVVGGSKGLMNLCISVQSAVKRKRNFFF